MIVPMSRARLRPIVPPQSDHILYGQVKILGMVVDNIRAATPSQAAAWSSAAESKLRQVFVQHYGPDEKITTVMSRNDDGSIVHKFFTNYLRDSVFCCATIDITKEPFP